MDLGERLVDVLDRRSPMSLELVHGRLQVAPGGLEVVFRRTHLAVVLRGGRRGREEEARQSEHRQSRHGLSPIIGAGDGPGSI